MFLTAGLGSAFAAGAAMAAPAEHAALSVDGMVLLRSLQMMFEFVANGMMRDLAGIAGGGDADTPGWAKLSHPLQAAAAQSATAPVAWIALPDGSYVTTYDNKPAPDRMTGEPFFSELMAGHSVEGATRISAVTGQRVIIMAAPIKRGGEAIGAVGFEISPRNIMDLVIQRMGFPSDLFLLALNDQGLIVLHSETGLIFESPDVGDPGLAAAVHRVLTERSGVVRYRALGRERLAVFSKSDPLGWHFILGRTVA